MLDQIIIDGIGSSDRFDASVRDRSIGEPKKKIIKQTVPYSNKTYDFSKLDGELYWEERPLEYSMEIMAGTPEELERKKTSFKRWVMPMMDAELHDPFIANYHFVVTFNDISFDDSEVEKTTAKVAFSAYPYKIANEKKSYSFPLTTAESSKVVENDSDHKVVPTFVSDVGFTVQLDGVSFSVPAGTTKDETFKLKEGTNALLISSTAGTGTLTIEFSEEVF